MALDPKVECVLNPNVADSVLVGLAWLHGREWLILSITLGCSAIDEHTLWPPDGATAIQELPQNCVTLGVPITNDNIELTFGIWVRNGNQ